MTTVGCVVLTRGNRPDDLRLAVASLLMQEGVEADVLVVGNGWQPEGLPEGVRGLGLEVDEGACAGRNAGAAELGGELLFFLDDDASLAGKDALSRVARRFEADPELGLLQLHVEPRDGGRRSRDWLPRLRVGDPAKDSELTVVWEGAVGIRPELFAQVGGWPNEFRIVHEGIDLAWRVMDAGYRVEYAGDIVALHPAPPAATVRHAYSVHHGLRNKVFVARRNLPLPLGALYVLMFALRRLPGLRSREDLRALGVGLRDGLREPCGERKRLRARTIWRMTRAGRPPVL